MFTPLLRLTGLTVGIWRCRGHGAGWSELEHVDRPEVVVPLTGAYIRQSDHRETVASPNVALFGNAGDTYRVRHPERAPLDQCAVLLLREDSVGTLTAAVRIRRSGRARRLPAGAVPVQTDTFLRVRRLMRATTTDALQAEELAVSVLVDLVGMASAGRVPTAAGQRRAVMRALEYVAARYRTPISLEEVAGVAGYSRFHFARMFRDEVGTPLYRYVRRLRLREGLHAVEQGAEDLSRLALSLGFSSHSHFTAAFRRTFGRPPSAMRGEGQERTPFR